MLFAAVDLDQAELEVAGHIDQLWNDLRYKLSPHVRWYGPLRRFLAAKHAQASNSIEGHNVSLEDAMALLGGDDGFSANPEDAAAVRNYGDAMTYVLQLADDETFEYSTGLLKSLHYSMMKHDLDVRPGRFRSGPVFVVDSVTGDSVYEGPESSTVMALVNELVAELNATEGSPASPWVHGAMAHLNLAMIHPFKDGNGRMARALQTLVLVRARIQSDSFISIEEYLGASTPEYYDVLARVGQGQWSPDADTRPWIRFVLKAHVVQARTIERRILESERLWAELDALRVEQGLDERVMGSLYSAAWGLRVRRSDHLNYAIDISERSASADLQSLVAAGLLEPVGERRGRYYVASPLLRELRIRTRVPRTPIEVSFGDDSRT